MSSTVDVNVLLSAVNADDSKRESCIAQTERLASGPERWHLFWPVLASFVRIATHPRIFPRPLSLRTALGVVDGLIAAPSVSVCGELDGFHELFATAQLEARGGNDVSDAHLVALMRQHGVSTIYSYDRGFRRFDGITAREPRAS